MKKILAILPLMLATIAMPIHAQKKSYQLENRYLSRQLEIKEGKLETRAIENKITKVSHPLKH